MYEVSPTGQRSKSIVRARALAIKWVKAHPTSGRTAAVHDENDKIVERYKMEGGKIKGQKLNPSKRKRNPTYVIKSANGRVAEVMAADATQARRKARDYGMGDNVSVAKKNPSRRKRCNPTKRKRVSALAPWGTYGVPYGPTRAERVKYLMKLGYTKAQAQKLALKTNPSVSGVKFTLKKVRLDSGGYVMGRGAYGGKYFGVGLPLYFYQDYETGDISGFLRATGKIGRAHV